MTTVVETETARASSATAAEDEAGDSLRAGRVRMVFVSDEISRELARVVEFLNGQMSPADVLAIEIKQYLGADGVKTLVPRVVGQRTREVGGSSARVHLGRTDLVKPKRLLRVQRAERCWTACTSFLDTSVEASACSCCARRSGGERA